MTYEQIHQAYDTACDAPLGGSLHIQHMPHFLLTDPNDNNTGHVHTFYEIIWFHEDGGSHHVDFQDYPVRKNTFFFLAPGQVHHFDGQTLHKGTLIQFCTDFMRDERDSDDLLLKYDVFHAPGAPCCQVTDESVVEELRRLVELMETEIAHGESVFGHDEMLRLLVRQFMILCYRHGNRPDTLQLDTLRPSHRLFIRFRQMVERDFMKKHAVGEYADALCVSVRTLTSSVSECSHATPLSLINNRIALEAKRLLRHGNLMVKEVATRLGYDDVSYFAKFFKRTTGVLPTVYQKGQ